MTANLRQNSEHDKLITTWTSKPLHTSSHELTPRISQYVTTNSLKHSEEAYGYEELVSTQMKDELSTALPLEVDKTGYNGMSPIQTPLVISLIPITTLPSSTSSATTEPSTLSKTVPTSHKTETQEHNTALYVSSTKIPSALNGSIAARSDYLKDDASKNTTYNHSNVVIGCSVFAVISVLVLLGLAIYWKIGANR